MKVSLEDAADKPPHVQAADAKEVEVRHNTSLRFCGTLHCDSTINYYYMLSTIEVDILTYLLDGYVKSLMGRTSKI